MTNNPQNRASTQEQSTQQPQETQVATQPEQAMAERLLLGTLPRPQPEPEKPEQANHEAGWPEHLQREMDLAIVTTFMSAGVIGLFLWMGGLF